MGNQITYKLPKNYLFLVAINPSEQAASSLFLYNNYQNYLFPKPEPKKPNCDICPCLTLLTSRANVQTSKPFDGAYMRYSSGKFTVDQVGFIQIASADVLAAVARGEIDLNRIAIEELASRGLDIDGRWVGFDRAKEILAQGSSE